MIFVPVSFVVALFLINFLIRMARDDADGRATVRPFIVLLAVMTVQSVVVGLRWGYGMVVMMPLMSVLAASIPPLSFLAFRSLTQEAAGYSVRDWPHALPILLLLALNLLWGAPIDAALILIFMGYGVALFWLARHGPDGLSASRLDGALRSYRSLQLMAASLIASSLSDIFISLDFSIGDGRHVPIVVTAFMTVILMLLGFAATLAEAGSARDNDDDGAGEAPQDSEAAVDERSATADDARIAHALDALMRDKALYKDVELNLSKLARRLGLPVRAVSNAVNRVHGISVSQYVNNYRVSAACQLLVDTDQPITTIVFESGFMTKSNFNREFLRVTGQSPSAWRQSQIHAQPQEKKPAIRRAIG
ncbi:helix-turn-helix domain-containing protein [Rhizobium oryziradicis]|uniref:AraC family transcriptional regulator n=1 Tax=Rhizobium oryziradicis TaxID=1867956 RepID=A0A1Q8ZU87_9HYPH|nr:AraC family transcriptional regulator [Rhizobium oryziradicis]OLP45499.1 AraC family transcriptional regulator [Rhizobium oryziradicis]